MHLGWDVVSVAAGGGGIPIRPVQLEGTYTPPAYLLADASGRLHTAGVDLQRSDLGIAVSDVRDVLGHQQIRIAGATWPVELVFRARLYNPLAAVGKYLRGKPAVVALPYPDDWPDEKVDEYCRLVELLDVITEPLPESVALSGYVRALGLVHPPEPGRRPIGATGVYSDGRICLVVAVHGDDEQPTESVGVPIAPEAMREAHAADNLVIEVMAAARSIGADTSTVLLTGNVCFNDALRLAFQNHLGHRLRVADHPMHALALGSAHLLVTDSESPDNPYPPAPPNPIPPHGTTGPGGAGAPAPGQGYGGATAPPSAPGPGVVGPTAPPSAPGPGVVGPPGQGFTGPAGSPGGGATGIPGFGYGGAGPTGGFPGAAGVTDSGRHAVVGPEVANPGVPGQVSGRHSVRAPQGPVLDQGPRHVGTPESAGRQADSPPAEGRHAARESAEEPTTRVDREQLGGLGAYASRFTRPPNPVADAPAEDDDEHRKGKLWGKVRDNLFGTPAIVGVVALAAVALHAGGELDHLADPVDATAAVDTRTGAAVEAAPTAAGAAAFDARSVTFDIRSDFGAWPSVQRASRVPPRTPDCALTPYARPNTGPHAIGDKDCAHLGVDNLRYLVPTVPGVTNQGPPTRI